MIFQEILNVIMQEIVILSVNLKGFMADNAQENWIAMRKIYGCGDPPIHMEGHDHTCLFHWPTNLDKITQKHICLFLQFQHKQPCKEYKDAKSLEKVDIKYHVIWAWSLSSRAETKKRMFNLSEGLESWH